jgi:intracellular sulfur oxidation DsrE/DsrF family protein
MRQIAITLLSFVALLLMSAQAPAAGPDGEVDRVLALAKAPPGVVFEVVGWDPTALKRAIPQVTVYAERLRARFPDLPVAVVTHGSEQFSLLASEKSNYGDLHAQVRALTGEQDVAVSVCGNHASWRGKTAGDFPDYVDVAVAAREKMGEYRGLGYLVIYL